jgi:hypothetical protein
VHIFSSSLLIASLRRLRISLTLLCLQYALLEYIHIDQTLIIKENLQHNFVSALVQVGFFIPSRLFGFPPTRLALMLRVVYKAPSFTVCVN